MNVHRVSYPESDSIGQDEAKFLYENHCSILVLEGLPVGSEFGIDLAVYQIGDKFKGIKLIPPGIHFIYASPIDQRTHQIGPRTGFLHDFSTKELIIKRWSVKDEDFDQNFQPNEELLNRYRFNLRDLDSYLGLYKFSTYKDYLCLTNKLTTSEVARLMPECGLLRAVPYLTNQDQTGSSSCQEQSFSESIIETSDEAKLLPNLKPKQSTVIHFTIIPRTHKDAGYHVDSNMITQYNLDSTMKLDKAFGSKDQDLDRLLAEFQFSYLSFILCHIYDSFEHWKTCLGLICNSEMSIKRESHTTFYCSFIQILTCQLKYIPEDLFLDIDDRRNLVRTNIASFLENVTDVIDHLPNKTQANSLRTLSDELRSYSETKFGWLFDLSPDDQDEPVVVEEE